MAEMVRSLVPVEELKGQVVADQDVINILADRVSDALLQRGVIKDELFTVEETMKMLAISSRNTLRKLTDHGLTPVYQHPNSRPRYRLSDITRYLNNLNHDRRRSRKTA